MAALMDALQITGPNALLQTRLPVPKPADGELLIKVSYVGICGTDVHLWQGNSFYIDNGYLTYPFVFGHEYTGEVVSSPTGSGFATGDRVVGHCMVECHVCDNCRKGRRHLCRTLKEVGLRFIPGAAAEHITVPAYAVTKLPDNLSMRAAALVEPTVTAYHAIERVQLTQTDRVAIIGSGTLGLLALLVAQRVAASVDVIGVEASELEFARSIGADRALRPEEAATEGYSVVIECSGVPSSTALAARLLDLGGRCALVGVVDDPVSGFHPSLLTLKDLTFHGILHGLDYYPTTVELFASGRVDPTVLIAQTGPIEEAPAMFEKMISPGRTRPKFVIEFEGEDA